MAFCPVIGVVERAFRQAEASTADAAVQIVAQAHQCVDSLIQVCAERFADLFPVFWCWRPVSGQAGQNLADFRQGQSELLRDHHKTEPPDICPLIPALSARIAPG